MSEPSAVRWNARRIASAMAIAALVGAAVWAHTKHVEPSAVAAWARSLGFWTVPAFVAAFVAGELLQVPGLAFIVASHAVFGPVRGFAVSYASSVLAVTIPFVLTRALRRTRGRAYEPKWRVLRALLDRVEASPIRSVVLLRVLLWLSPPLNYALAFTGIRARDYVIGSALGLVPFVAGIVLVLSLVPAN